MTFRQNSRFQSNKRNIHALIQAKMLEKAHEYCAYAIYSISAARFTVASSTPKADEKVR
jgi:hypothetical protein